MINFDVCAVVATMRTTALYRHPSRRHSGRPRSPGADRTTISNTGPDMHLVVSAALREVGTLPMPETVLL